MIAVLHDPRGLVGRTKEGKLQYIAQERPPCSPAKGGREALRDFCGTLLCSLVLDDRNGRPAHRFRSISSPTESGSYNIGSLQRLAIAPPGRPYKANVGGSIPSAPTTIDHLGHTYEFVSTFCPLFVDEIQLRLRARERPAGLRFPDFRARVQAWRTTGEGRPAQAARGIRIALHRRTESLEQGSRAVFNRSGLILCGKHVAPDAKLVR